MMQLKQIGILKCFLIVFGIYGFSSLLIAFLVHERARIDGGRGINHLQFPLSKPHSFPYDGIDDKKKEKINARNIFYSRSWFNSTPKALPLRAYMEQPVQYWIEGTKTELNPFGEPVKPIPLRKQSPKSLKQVTYNKVKSCSDIPNHFPVGRKLEYDENGKILHKNVNNDEVLIDPLSEAPFCPVDADPFLPWIHDIFPSNEGEVIHFVAQNKRRCNTGDKFKIEIERLEPQVALMQPVSVMEAYDVPSELWEGGDEKELRYKLTTFDNAKVEGKLTRFICKFKAVAPDGTILSLGESLSVFPINYEVIQRRKGFKSMLTKPGKDNGFFWLSSFQFDCPVPAIGGLREAIRSRSNVIGDAAIAYIDLIPIRTRPRVRVDGMHYSSDILSKLSAVSFNVSSNWGSNHVLPKVAASGRWENIPICKFHAPRRSNQRKSAPIASTHDVEKETIKNEQNKPHYLVGCVWTSAIYKTRGNQVHVSDIEQRLSEWIEFHILAGFDHIYVYDNSEANVINGTNLSHITNKFESHVTRIEWPFRVCNNNIPAHKNTGERSSQYAAETSCLKRYGPFTEWMASFDPDEYMIPAGNYTNLKDMLKDAKKSGTNILGFRSTRSMLNGEFLIPYYGEKKCQKSREIPTCQGKDPNRTFLETYNCDMYPLPKPRWAERAKKQIYRPEYVMSHFVHYSTITKPMLSVDNAKAFSYFERPPSERFVDELKEAFMLHAKVVDAEATELWHERCKLGYKQKNRSGNDKCRVGFPYPKGIEYSEVNMPEYANEDGYQYNCFSHERISNYWMAKLNDALKKRGEMT